MAQWNKNKQDYLNQERTLFEVYQRADKYGRIYDDVGQGFNGDLFGRVKVANNFTLFDAQHRYEQNGHFDDVIVGTGATVEHISAESSAKLEIGTASGEYIHRESMRVFPYQPGKSLQTLQTFVFNEGKENLVQRAGYASTENGIMLELSGTQLNIIKRTAISGVGTTVTVPQSEWNHDTFDGSGGSSNPSGITMDISKAQLMFTEYEWLGVGCVRVGFVNADGSFHTAHIFNHANTLDSVYMTTATLPVRYEIENVGVTTGSSRMKQICVSVQSNGGYEKVVNETIIRRTSATTVGTSFEPLVSVRLKPGYTDGVAIPAQFGAFPTSSGDVFEVVLIKNATLTGASFGDSDSTILQQDTSATALTGGTIVDTTYTTGGGFFFGQGSSMRKESTYNFDMQLGRTQAKESDIYTVAARTFTGTGTIIGYLGIFDLTS